MPFPDIFPLLAIFCALMSVAGCVQAALGSALVLRFRKRERHVPPARTLPAMTVLKPLHGDEPLLEEALESFCTQDYPHYQVIFGVQRANDPAIEVVERLMRRYPDLDLQLVVNGALHGLNRKISNVMNLMPRAVYDVLVISDSDIHVSRDYLRQLAATMEQPGAGVVTTLYAGRPASNALHRLLAACQINHNFLPGVLLSRYLGRQDCLGATMAIRRDMLEQIGGLPALVAHVADDAVLGQLVRAHGKDIAIAGCMTWTTIGEPDLAHLLRHELRWGRTVQALAPAGYAASCIQLPLFWLSLAWLLQPHALWSLKVFIGGWAFRAVCALLMDRSLGEANPVNLILLPFRDWLSAGIMVGSFSGTQVDWRGHTMHVTAPRDLHTAAPPYPATPFSAPIPAQNAGPVQSPHNTPQTVALGD